VCAQLKEGNEIYIPTHLKIDNKNLRCYTSTAFYCSKLITEAIQQQIDKTVIDNKTIALLPEIIDHNTQLNI